MFLLFLICVVFRALWKIDVYLISTLVNKSLYDYTSYIFYMCRFYKFSHFLSSLWRVVL